MCVYLLANTMLEQLGSRGPVAQMKEMCAVVLAGQRGLAGTRLDSSTWTRVILGQSSWRRRLLLISIIYPLIFIADFSK